MTLAIIQARLGSRRLPRKVLAPINGVPMVECVVRRVRAVPSIDHVVVATPIADAEAIQAVVSCDVIGVRGDPMDVLQRYACVARQLPWYDPIVRVTADCPSWAPTVGEAVLALYRQDDACEYAWNVCEGSVDGEDTEVFSRRVLLEADRTTCDAFDREHVTPAIRRSAVCRTLRTVRQGEGRKTSIDTLDELMAVSA